MCRFRAQTHVVPRSRRPGAPIRIFRKPGPARLCRIPPSRESSEIAPPLDIRAGFEKRAESGDLSRLVSVQCKVIMLLRGSSVPAKLFLGRGDIVSAPIASQQTWTKVTQSKEESCNSTAHVLEHTRRNYTHGSSQALMDLAVLGWVVYDDSKNKLILRQQWRCWLIGTA